MKDIFLKVWYSELNYWMTKYNCTSIEELGNTLRQEHSLELVVL